jgi:hypothetical protein
LRGWTDPIDFLFVDGWHEYNAVLEDVRGFGALLTDSGVVCIDDVTTYAEVDEASRRAIADLGLHHYGVVGTKAWAGKSATPPTCLRTALAFERRMGQPVLRLYRRMPRVSGHREAAAMP